MVGVDGEQFIGADQRERDERDSGFDGHESAAGEEGLGASVGGATSFGEDDKREAMFEGVDSSAKAGDSGAGTGLIDRDLAGAVEVPADERNLPQALFGDDAELEGKFGEEDRGVVVAEVVGGVDRDRVKAKLFGSDDGDGRQADL